MNYTPTDKEIKLQIAMYAQEFTHQENLVLAIKAIEEIDGGNPLCLVIPRSHSPQLRAAINLLRHLSPRARAEEAILILYKGYVQPTEDAPSTLIE